MSKASRSARTEHASTTLQKQWERRQPIPAKTPVKPMKDQKRNLNPTAPAYVAMALYGSRYAAQKGGSMDFWDGLSEYEKRSCAELARKVREAPMEETRNR